MAQEIFFKLYVNYKQFKYTQYALFWNMYINMYKNIYCRNSLEKWNWNQSSWEKMQSIWLLKILFILSMSDCRLEIIWVNSICLEVT